MTDLLFLSKGEESSSTRYRVLQLIPLLSDAGYTVAHACASGRGGLAFLAALAKAAKADIVIVLRKTFPFPHLWLLRVVSRRLVFDFDDAIFCNTDGSASSVRRRRFSLIVNACDHIFAGNAFLARNAAAINSAVTVLPTCLDADRYNARSAKPRNVIDLVWIGSSSTKKYLLEALPALQLAAERVPGLRLKIIADFDFPEAGFPVITVPWSAETEVIALTSSHIGIAPMRDDDWSRGKCALKILQYMAAGLPVVSSAVGANAEVVDAGQSGYLASNDIEWCNYIVELASNDELRHRMGMEGQHKVQTAYSLASAIQRMRSVFDQLG